MKKKNHILKDKKSKLKKKKNIQPFMLKTFKKYANRNCQAERLQNKTIAVGIKFTVMLMRNEYHPVPFF